MSIQPNYLTTRGDFEDVLKDTELVQTRFCAHGVDRGRDLFSKYIVGEFARLVYYLDKGVQIMVRRFVSKESLNPRFSTSLEDFDVYAGILEGAPEFVSSNEPRFLLPMEEHAERKSLDKRTKDLIGLVPERFRKVEGPIELVGGDLVDLGDFYKNYRFGPPLSRTGMIQDNGHPNLLIGEGAIQKVLTTEDRTAIEAILEKPFPSA